MVSVGWKNKNQVRWTGDAGRQGGSESYIWGRWEARRVGILHLRVR